MVTIEGKQEQRLIGFAVDFHSKIYKDMLTLLKGDRFKIIDYDKILLSISSTLGLITHNILDDIVSCVTSGRIEVVMNDLLVLVINIANEEQIMSALCESRLQRIIKELKLAYKKHGMQYEVSYEKQFLIIYEEFTEVLDAIHNKDYKHSIEEIYQTIAMCIKFAWLINERT